MFKVITDIKRIAELNKKLHSELSTVFKGKESRKITSRGGTFSRNVYFRSVVTGDVNAWTSFSKNNDHALVNFFLQGQPGDTESMHIAVQLNFPSNAYNKQTAGVFVEDESGAVFIAHRGDLTLNGRLKRSDVLNEFSPHVTDAQENGRSLKLILIGGLNDNANTLAKRLLEFAKQAREVAQKLGHQKNKKSHDERSTDRTAAQSQSLRSYFNEFSGETITKGYSSGVRVVKHGDIVEALAKLFKKENCQKSQAVDLVETEKKFWNLYEVKTTASTTDIYTGIGQLLLHGHTLAEQYKPIQMQKFLVLPKYPKEAWLRACAKLGIKIIVYKPKGETYVFDGLK